MKRIFSIFICLSYISLAFSYDFFVDGFYCNILSETEKTVEVTNATGRPDACYSGDIIIPTTVVYNSKEYKVIKVGDNAFNLCKDMTSVVFPETVKKIGLFAFCHCEGLTSISLPNSITSLAAWAFANCNNLEEIQLSDSLDQVTSYLFEGCEKLREITLPRNIYLIGQGAFENCTLLESVFCFGEIRDFSRNAFSGCNNLSSISLVNYTPSSYCTNSFENYHYDNVTLHVPFGSKSLYNSANIWKNFKSVIEDRYEESVIYYTTSDEQVFQLNLENSWESNGVKNYFGADTISNTYINGIGILRFEGSPTLLADRIFEENCKLTSIRIPNSIGYIGEEAFDGCNNLKSISIPDGTDSIGSFAFRGCVKLESIHIGKNVKKIGEDAFQSCSAVTEISVDEENTHYDSRDNCNALIETSTNKLIQGSYNCIIPEGIRIIGEFAFLQMAGLSEVSFPTSLEKIETNAFASCSGIESIFIPSNVTSIDGNAFNGCSGLSAIEVSSSNPVYYSQDQCIIEKSSKKLIRGCTASTIPTDIQSIGDYAFCGYGLYPNPGYNGNSPASVSIPSGVTYIGYLAFGLSNLISIEIPDNVILDGWSFWNNEKLKDVIIHKNVELRGACFQRSKGIENVTCESNLSNQCFAECSNLQNVKLLNGVKRIGGLAFYKCGITNIEIPSTVDSIHYNAFVDGLNNSVNFYVSWINPLKVDSRLFSADELENATLHVPYGTKFLYEQADGWKNFGTIVENEPDFIEIADGTAYTRTEELTSKIKYTRSFLSTTWQSLYVPFSIPVEKLKEYGLTVAELNDTHQWDNNGDGIADSTRIEFFTLTSGETQANYPYLIKADLAFDLTLELENVELKAAEENSYDCSSMKQMFTFVGTYSGVSGTDMYNSNYYAMAGGGLKRSNSASAGLKPQRWYLKIENRNGSPVQYFAPSIRFSIDGIDEDPEATGLGSVLGDENAEGSIYSLDGMTQHPAQMTSVIYVQNGKKIIVR